MPFGDGATPEAEPPPEDAFALLGNEYRAGIIQALGAAQGTEGPRPTLSFSDLYSAADPGIATSQFNYHLQKLVGPFVDKTEDGYRLRHEAVELYRTIVAGTFTTASSSMDRFEVGADCFYCDTPIHAWYRDRRFVVGCPDCDREYSDTTVPPSLVTGDEGELLTRVDQYVRHRILAFSKGVCSVCVSGLDTRILRGDELAQFDLEQLDALVHRSCGHCGAQQYMSVGLSLLYDAALIAFFQDRGLDVTDTPLWELEFAMTDRYLEVRSSDPWELVLAVPRGGDRLELVVTGDLTLVDTSVT